MQRNNYEFIMIVDAGLADEEADEVFSKFKTFINDNDGEVKFESVWGRRRLAYQIKKRQHGIYRLFYFEGNGPLCDDMKRELSYDENVLKYFIIAVKDLEKAYNEFESLKENPSKNVKLITEVLGA